MMGQRKAWTGAGLTAVMLVLPTGAFPHGGGLDDLGCHHNRRAGGYHCHRGLLAGRSAFAE